jgi:CheY-like chemotaxis protein
LGEAEKGCFRARDLTQKLLAFSKGGAPVRQTVSLGSMINDTIELATRGTPCTSEVISPPDAWLVNVDPVQLSQVFTNLCINACQAMPQGGLVQVRIENVVIRPGDPIALEEGRYVKVSFRDQGIGIPVDHQTKIFNPYFSTKPKGSGLGLATSYAVIKNHGGLITFDSREGEGTTFYLYLRASDEAAPRKVELTGAEQPASKGKVLLMDDEEAIRDLIVDLLSLMGYEVSVASDGAECIELYTQSMTSDKPFDVVILDLTIPGGMGGQEAVKRLLEIDPSVKAIVSSGYSDAPIMGEYAKYGFREVIPKPYDVADLCRIIETVMGRAES